MFAWTRKIKKSFNTLSKETNKLSNATQGFVDTFDNIQKEMLNVSANQMSEIQKRMAELRAY